MNDSISRQAAIDAVTDELDMIDHVPQWVFDRLEGRLKQLPPVQPKPCNYVNACNELAMNNTSSTYGYFQILKEFEKYGYILVDTAELRQLSSAQPEIICCKDCKHHWTHKCMDSMPIERCDLEQTFYDAEHDFCSLAERRTDV